MITIPAIYLLIPFGVIFVIMAITILAQLYHGYRFGKNDPVTMSVNTAFLVLVAGVIVSAGLLLSQVDWSTKFTITTPTTTSPALEGLTPSGN